MRGYWLGWRKGKSAFTADALAGMRERTREKERGGDVSSTELLPYIYRG
jgi:hypothetical protein